MLTLLPLPILGRTTNEAKDVNNYVCKSSPVPPLTLRAVPSPIFRAFFYSTTGVSPTTLTKKITFLWWYCLAVLLDRAPDGPKRTALQCRRKARRREAFRPPGGLGQQGGGR